MRWLDGITDYRKGRGTRDQIASIHWIMEKAREFQKNIYFCFIDYAKAFDCMDHNKLWKILKEMGIPDHLTCLLRNLYAHVGFSLILESLHSVPSLTERLSLLQPVCLISLRAPLAAMLVSVTAFSPQGWAEHSCFFL